MDFLTFSPSKTLATLIILTIGFVQAQPTSNSLNSQPVSNQLTNGDLIMKPGETTTGQFHFRNPNSAASQQQQQQSQQVYPINNQPGYQSTSSNYPPASYVRDAQSSPFFGLASNGEIQLSAYFSQLFWGFVAVTVTIAAIIYLIRLFFPTAGIGNIVKKLNESGAARGLDLDKITNVVYGALDSYGKWAVKDTPKIR